MSDIAERMRRWQVGELDGFDELIVGDLTDGANEIGRLCSELNMEVVTRRKVESDLADWESALQKQNAEIERLRMERDEARKLMREWDAEVQRLRDLRDTMLKGEVAIRQRDADEIERLREQLIDLAESAATTEHYEDAKFYGVSCLHCNALQILASLRSD